MEEQLETQEQGLIREVLNLLENDFEVGEYEVIDELLTKLFQIPESRSILLDYLVDADHAN